MDNEHRKFNPSFVRLAGASAIISGIFMLGSLFYIVVVMSSMGFNMTMFGDTERLLSWIAKNKITYSFLWVLVSASYLFLLPVPAATSQIFRHRTSRSSALASGAQIIGLCGLQLLILCPVIFFSVSPVTAIAYSNKTATMVPVHEALATMAMDIRLFGEFLLGIWMLFVGAHLIRKKLVDFLGWYLVALFFFILIVSTGKAFDVFDFEPFLEIILAATFIWFGRELRQRVIRE